MSFDQASRLHDNHQTDPIITSLPPNKHIMSLRGSNRIGISHIKDVPRKIHGEYANGKMQVI
jgi:hypothetical protein